MYKRQSSIRAAARYLGNSYICSSDNYFEQNPFENRVDAPYYAAVYAAGQTREWCLTTDREDWITGVTVGGHDQWYICLLYTSQCAGQNDDRGVLAQRGRKRVL